MLSQNCIKAEAEEHNIINNNSDEVAALRSELNTSRKEIYFLRIILYPNYRGNFIDRLIDEMTM